MLVCSLHLKTIYYYDPIGIENDENIKSKIFCFLKEEIKINEKMNKIGLSRKFKYEKISESEIYDHLDSGVYILRQVCRIALDHRLIIRPESLDEFRFKFLNLLLKNGTRVIG